VKAVDKIGGILGGGGGDLIGSLIGGLSGIGKGKKGKKKKKGGGVNQQMQQLQQMQQQMVAQQAKQTQALIAQTAQMNPGNYDLPGFNSPAGNFAIAQDMQNGVGQFLGL
jgi:hypothetical protein